MSNIIEIKKSIIIKYEEREKRLPEKLKENINKLFNKHRKLVDGLLVLASCFIIILMPKLITIFSVLKDSYGYQLVHMNKTYNPSITVFILMTLTVIPFILQYRRDVKLDRDFNF